MAARQGKEGQCDSARPTGGAELFVGGRMRCHRVVVGNLRGGGHVRLTISLPPDACSLGHNGHRVPYRRLPVPPDKPGAPAERIYQTKTGCLVVCSRLTRKTFLQENSIVEPIEKVLFNDSVISRKSHGMANLFMFHCCVCIA